MNAELQKEDFNYSALYRGTVLDNNDPSKLGRVKVNVLGIFDTIAAANLPWASPMQPIGSGAGIGYGVFSVPEIDSNVFVLFEGGDIYQPVYIGSAPDGVHGLPSERTANYPNRRIIRTKAGIVIYIDDTTGSVTITANDVVITAGDVTMSGDLRVNGDVRSDGNVRSDGVFNNVGLNGKNGTFKSADSPPKTITVSGGIITLIVPP